MSFTDPNAAGYRHKSRPDGTLPHSRCARDLLVEQGMQGKPKVEAEAFW
jgi:hypothetical protein